MPVSLLPIVLFALGIASIVWALRIENSNKPSQEMLATLKGVANVKREVSQLQKGLRAVEAQAGDHELRLIRNESIQDELRSAVETQRAQLDSANRSTKAGISNQTGSMANVNNVGNISNVSDLGNGRNVSNVSRVSNISNMHTPGDLSDKKGDGSSVFTKAGSNRYPNLGNQENAQVLPDKYRWALELSEQGWTVAEIAGHLGISRDAVNMILSTAQRGGEL
jgi:hypothetical protein